MKKTLAVLAAAAALGGATFVSHGAMAQTTVTFDTGNVAIGYSDGYWDRNHGWHNWAREEDMRAYRAAKNAEWHEWKHDRDKDMGWHERHF